MDSPREITKPAYTEMTMETTRMRINHWRRNLVGEEEEEEVEEEVEEEEE